MRRKVFTQFSKKGLLLYRVSNLEAYINREAEKLSSHLFAVSLFLTQQCVVCKQVLIGLKLSTTKNVKELPWRFLDL